MRRSEVPLPCDPIGLSRCESAAYIGVSAPMFDQMVDDGRMPPAKVINSRRIWDREALKAAFKALPDKVRGNTWDEDQGEARPH